MLPTYTIENLDWLGWLWLAFMLAAVAATWVWHTRRKARTSEESNLERFSIDGFADCHYPTGVAGVVMLLRLAMIRDEVMAHCEDTYYSQQDWIVPKVALIFGEPSEKHPNVEWSRAGDRIVLRIQDGMYWHFAGEVHNVFRYGMHGVGSSDHTYGDADRKAAFAVRTWVKAMYYEEA
jgi:hypothetical protein